MILSFIRLPYVFKDFSIFNYSTSLNITITVDANGVNNMTNVTCYYNASGGTYIYMAFAENPFKNANAR